MLSQVNISWSGPLVQVAPHSTTKPSSHKQSPTTPTKQAPTTAIDSRFIFFAVNFLPDLFYSMTIIFWFFCFIIVLPFSVLFFYFCWLRIWGNNEPPAATNIPLRERLGSLPPVPEQQWHFFKNIPFKFSFHFISTCCKICFAFSPYSIWTVWRISSTIYWSVLCIFQLHTCSFLIIFVSGLV